MKMVLGTIIYIYILFYNNMHPRLRKGEGVLFWIL